MIRQRSVSEVGSSDIRKNDSGDRIASAAVEKIIVLCFESYKNKERFPCNKACGSFIARTSSQKVRQDNAVVTSLCL